MLMTVRPEKTSLHKDLAIDKDSADCARKGEPGGEACVNHPKSDGERRYV